MRKRGAERETQKENERELQSTRESLCIGCASRSVCAVCGGSALTCIVSIFQFSYGNFRAAKTCIFEQVQCNWQNCVCHLESIYNWNQLYCMHNAHVTKRLTINTLTNSGKWQKAAASLSLSTVARVVSLCIVVTYISIRRAKERKGLQFGMHKNAATFKPNDAAN